MNQVLTYIPTNNITDLNELIYAGANLVCENIGILLKNTKAKSKPGWEFGIETQKENLGKQLKVVKQKKNAEINRKEKTTQEKLTVQLEEIHQKVLAKEGRLKRYRQRVKQYRQNRTFQNNERKFYQELRGDDNKTHQQPNAKETERFWTKIWQPKQHNEKAEWINHITRELEQLEEGPKAEIHTDLLRTTLKKESNRKTPGHDGIHGFWFKKSTSVHDRLVLEMNKCLQTDESKTRRKNLAMAWIDYKKAYDMVPHSWIINSLKMYKILDEVINFIDKTMKTWRIELTAGERKLAEAKIQRGIFQGDALSPLLFIIAMMSLNHILRKCTCRYKLGISQEKVNHLTYMDDIKLLAKNEKELETLIHTVRIYNRDIGMEFGLEKCAKLVMKSGQKNLTGWNYQTRIR